MATLADLLIEIGIDPRGVDKGAGQVEGKLKKTWGRIQKAALVGGAAAGVAVMAGLVSGMDSEVATDKLAASLGAGGKDAEELGKIAGDLYKRGLGQSMEDVTAALGAVKSSFADLNKAGIEKTTEQAINMANAFEVDVKRAAQVASQAVTSGLAKDAGHAMDLLTASMQRVPSAVREDLLDAIDEYGPFMNNIGVTGERAFGLLVKSAEKGMYGIDKTGDALKEFTVRATDMSAASKAGYDILGMSQEKMSAELLKGGEAGERAFGQIVNGLLGIQDPVKQSQAALALFGTPLEDLNVNDIPKFLAGLTDASAGLDGVAGSTDAMGKTLNDNAKTQLEAFKRSVQSALVVELAKVIPYLEATFGWLSRNSAWVKPLAIGLGLLALAIGLVTAATWAWGVAIAVTPIGWIIIGIGLLVIAIAWLITKTRFFQTIWEGLWGFMKMVGAWFAGPFANFFVQLWNKLGASLTRAKGQFMGVINFIKGLFLGWLKVHMTVANKIIAGFGKVVSFFSSARTRISKSLSGMWDGLRNGFRSAVNWIIGKWNSLSFSIPSFSILGKNFGGGTVSVPKIPQLAEGGIVKASPGGTLVNVGEGGQDEAVVPLGRGGQALSRGDDRPIIVEIAPGGEADFRRWIQRTIRVKGPVGASGGVA